MTLNSRRRTGGNWEEYCQGKFCCERCQRKSHDVEFDLAAIEIPMGKCAGRVLQMETGDDLGHHMVRKRPGQGERV